MREADYTGIGRDLESTKRPRAPSGRSPDAIREPFAAFRLASVGPAGTAVAVLLHSGRRCRIHPPSGPSRTQRRPCAHELHRVDGEHEDQKQIRDDRQDRCEDQQARPPHESPG